MSFIITRMNGFWNDLVLIHLLNWPQLRFAPILEPAGYSFVNCCSNCLPSKTNAKVYESSCWFILMPAAFTEVFWFCLDIAF